MSGPQYSEALGAWLFALHDIHEKGDKAGLPIEIRLQVFGHWLRGHQPPWNIRNEIRIPDWVKPIFEETWFRNTEFILPAFTVTPVTSRQSAAMSLEVHVVSFLERLCRRQGAQTTPVTVEVAVHVNGDLRLSQSSIRRLLLVAYLLGARKELLNIKVVVNTDSHRGNLEANELIAKPLEEQLQNACSTMREFREGSINMTQVYDSVGRAYDTLGLQGFGRENVAATVLSEHIVWSQVYQIGPMHSRSVLLIKLDQFMKNVENKEKAEAKEEAERAKQS